MSHQQTDKEIDDVVINPVGYLVSDELRMAVVAYRPGNALRRPVYWVLGHQYTDTPKGFTYEPVSTDLHGRFEVMGSPTPLEEEYLRSRKDPTMDNTARFDALRAERSHTTRSAAIQQAIVLSATSKTTHTVWQVRAIITPPAPPEPTVELF